MVTPDAPRCIVWYSDGWHNVYRCRLADGHDGHHLYDIRQSANPESETQ